MNWTALAWWWGLIVVLGLSPFVACAPVDQAAAAAPVAGEAALYQGETLCLVDQAAKGADVATANAKCLIDPNDAGAAAHGAALVSSCKSHAAQTVFTLAMGQPDGSVELVRMVPVQISYADGANLLDSPSEVNTWAPDALRDVGGP